MNNKSLSVGLIVVAILAIIGLGMGSKEGARGLQGSTGPQGPKGEQGIQGPQGPAGKDGVTKVVTQPVLGAMAGPDFATDYFSVNGVPMFFTSATMRAATTTLCAMRAPNSTSTIESVSWQITRGTTTAATIDIGYGTTPYATSTNLLAAQSVASGAQASESWSAVGNGTADDIIAPNVYLLVKTAGAGLGGYTYTGTCKAEFKVL